MRGGVTHRNPTRVHPAGVEGSGCPLFSDRKQGLVTLAGRTGGCPLLDWVSPGGITQEALVSREEGG